MAWRATPSALEVRMGTGCRLRPPQPPCNHIDGSPSELLRWEPRPISAVGMNCTTPYDPYLAGVTYHFVCQGRDEYLNHNSDPNLIVHAEFMWIEDSQRVTDHPSNGWVTHRISDGD